MTIRVLLALFSGLNCLVPFAYFGDKNESWATRLAMIGFIAGMIFLIDLSW